MGDLLIIKTFPDRTQAELARSTLQSCGIESIVRADDCGGARPSLAIGSGGVQLFVREEDAGRAGEVLKGRKS